MRHQGNSEERSSRQKRKKKKKKKRRDWQSQRTFRFTPLGLAFRFFRFSNTPSAIQPRLAESAVSSSTLRFLCSPFLSAWPVSVCVC